MARYQKLDSELGFVEDVAEIEYLKFQNLRHTILGNMLGDFDEAGNYVVDPEIVRELISMPKHIVETLDNLEIVVSDLKLDKQISFLVTFEGERATLSLIEKLSFDANYKTDSGIFSNVNEFLLDEVETSGVVDKTILYRRWNISETEGNVLDVFSMDEETLASLYKIVARFKTNLVSNQILMEKEEELEEIEAGYTVEVMEILTHYPSLKEAVDNDIKKLLGESKEFIKLDKPYFAKTLNEIVTQKIEENISVLNEKEQAEFNVELRNAKVNYNTNIRGALDIVEVSKSSENELEAQKEKIVKLDTSSKIEKSLTDTAKDFIEAEKATRERVEEDIVVAVTGKLPPKEDLSAGEQPLKRKRSALADAVLSAVGRNDRATVGTGTGGAVVGAPAAGKASNRAKLLGKLLGAGLGVEPAEYVGKNTKKVIKDIQTAIGAETKTSKLEQEAETKKTETKTNKNEANVKKPDNKKGKEKGKEKPKEKKKEAGKEKPKEKGATAKNATSSFGGWSSGGGGSSLINKAARRGQETDYNAQSPTLGAPTPKTPNSTTNPRENGAKPVPQPGTEDAIKTDVPALRLLEERRAELNELRTRNKEETTSQNEREHGNNPSLTNKLDIGNSNVFSN